MNDPNASTRWGLATVSELASAGIRTVCIAPGSRSTPIVMGAAAHPDIETYSILDERSSAYFAVGRAKRTGRPAAIVSTSGTAAANFHPAIIEAYHSRTPLVVCTADRPPELQESGANQTVSQSGLFRDAVRWAPTLPPPSDDRREEAALRAIIGTAVARTRRPVPGPVHLNLPFRKPLSPQAEGRSTTTPEGTRGDSHSVSVRSGVNCPDRGVVDDLVRAIESAERGLLIAGPSSPTEDPRSLLALAEATGFPLLVDPLSGLRYGCEGSVVGGYDAFLDSRVSETWPAPDLVIRTGARPTSTRLQAYVSEHRGRHVLLDASMEYRDPTFSTTDIVDAETEAFVDAVLDRSPDRSGNAAWQARFREAESGYWDLVSVARAHLPPEGRIAHEVFERPPPGSAVFISNSMPIRDADRFGRPAPEPLAAYGNRGASGIDGILSTGLGVGSAGDGETVILTGDLAFYHDMNGLLSVRRCGVDATIVVVDNDGGGIFYQLPIAAIDPPFTEQFKTPHGLEFEHAAELYGLEYVRATPDSFVECYEDALGTSGTTIVDVEVDAAANHRARDAFQRTVADRLSE